MKNSNRTIHIFVALSCLILSAGWLHADTVKLKDGTSLDGKITYEGTDFIKLEVAISASIKETKTILRTEIGEIIKAAPDDVALDAIRKQMPAPAMLTADGYRAMIEKGPKAFLAQFPASRHKPEVEKVLSELTLELDQVERGFIKLDGAWISPQERQQFSALTDSKIRLLSMKRRLAAGDMIGTLRDFEILEEQFYGTPAFATALTDAKQMLPGLGARFQRVLADVGVRNEKWEKDKLLLDEVARAQVEGARARELEAYNKAVAQEKSAGIKWLTINENSAESLNGALQTIRSEMDRLAGMDVVALTALGENLVAADKLIAEGKLAEARTAIGAATAGMAATKSADSKTSKSKSSKSGASAKTSYIASLNEKITAAEKALVAAKEQAANTALADKAASVIKSAESAVAKALSPDSATPADGSVPAEGTEVAKEEAPKSGNSNAELEDLLAATATKSAPAKATETKKTGSSTTKRPTKKSSSKAASDDDEDDDDVTKKAKPVVADADDGGGGFKVQYVIWGVTALLIIVVAAMKFGGLGGSKA